MALNLDGTTGITSDSGTPVIENLNTTATGIDITGQLTTTGNVGIGTSDPAKRLSVVDSSTGEVGMIIRNSNSAASGQSAAIVFETSGGTQGDDASSAAKIAAFREGAGTTGSLRFYTTNAGVSGERLRIDSAGRVTMPYQPCFQTGFGSTVFPANQVVNTVTFLGSTVGTLGLSGVTTFDVGGGINTSNGRYTAPVSGKYFMSITIGIENGDASDQNNELSFYVNGTSRQDMLIEVEANTVNPLLQGFPVILDLTAGDYVQIATQNLTSGNDWSISEFKWTGFLIG